MLNDTELQIAMYERIIAFVHTTIRYAEKLL